MSDAHTSGSNSQALSIEVQPFITAQNNKNINIINNNAQSQSPPLSTSKKTSIASVSGVTMILIGTFLYGVFGILGRLSAEGAKSVPYESASVVLIAEGCKFILSFMLLIKSQGVNNAINSIHKVPFKQWFLFLVPALLYSITNNLDFYILRYMDPASMQVLVQSKIMSTALLWWLWFKKPIDKQQWLSLCLLCGGSMLVAWPKSNTSENEMYVEWPFGPLLILVQISLSAIAGIFTESVYKTFGRNREIHIDNLSMYFWGICANFMQYLYCSNTDNCDYNPSGDSSFSSEKGSLLHGFNRWAWILVFCFAIQGLTISQIIKHFSNIIKLFMSGASIIVSGVLTWMIFGLEWSVSYMIGLACVICAVFLYKTERNLCR